MHLSAIIKDCAARTNILKLLLGSLLLALASCSTSASSSVQQRPSISILSQSAINRPIVTTGCGKTPLITPGSSTNVAVAINPAAADGNHTRLYHLHLPAEYTNDHPYSVVLVFHGAQSNTSSIESSTGFSQLADKGHFIAAYPQGLPIPPNSLGAVRK